MARHESNNGTARQPRPFEQKMTRLTDSFGKKIENHRPAVALLYTSYNLGRVLQTLRVTPAVQAGIRQHVWSIQKVLSPAGLSVAPAP